MALIEVKGYVNKPKTAKGGKGEFATFTLAERQLDRNKEPHKVFYNVADFSTAEPPKESSFVTVKGFLNIRDYETANGKGKSLDITAKEITVAPSKEATPAADDSFEDF